MGPIPHAAGVRFYDVAQADAHGKLIASRPIDLTADAENFGSRAGFGERQVPEPLGAIADDMRNTDQRFNIVCNRGLAPETLLRGIRGGLFGVRPFAFKGIDLGRHLPADVATPASMHHDIKSVAAVQNVVAQITRCFGFLYLPFENSGQHSHTRAG